MPAVLSCHGLSKTHHGRPLFEGLSFSIAERERVALVGPNGAGKSTLLRLLAGEEVPDEGQVALAKGARLAWVQQEDRFEPGTTARAAIAGPLAGHGLEAHELEARVSIALSKAGFGEEDSGAGGVPGFDANVDVLSGGWKKRLALARGLAQQPDILILDEPTNHLDLDGVLWLEKVLRDATFAFVLVSHDRYLLDDVAQVTLELDPRLPAGFLRCEGGLSDLVERRDALLEAQRATQRAVAAKLAREVTFLKKTPRAQRCKQNSRFELADELRGQLSELNRRQAHGEAVKLGFEGTGRRGTALLAADGLGHGYPGPDGAKRWLFRKLSFGLGPGERLGVLGPNGCGKTTLLDVLAGLREPQEGQVKRANGLRCVRFDQQRAQLDPHWTLREALAPNGEQVTYGGRTLHVSSWARRFLFPTEQLQMHLHRLSGGEKARVMIARLMLEPADVLLLDEPTNDLDLPSLEVLEESLLEFPGVVVLVTHDRFLLDRVATSVLGLGLGVEADGSVGRPLADASQYGRARAAARKQEAAGRASDGPKAAAAPPKAAPPPRRVEKLTNKERAEFQTMEETIQKAEAEVVRLQGELETPGQDARRLQAAATALGAAQARVEQLYARWADLEARIAAGG